VLPRTLIWTRHPLAISSLKTHTCAPQVSKRVVASDPPGLNEPFAPWPTRELTPVPVPSPVFVEAALEACRV
jgi:hypothetical protein